MAEDGGKRVAGYDIDAIAPLSDGCDLCRDIYDALPPAVRTALEDEFKQLAACMFHIGTHIVVVDEEQ